MNNLMNKLLPHGTPAAQNRAIMEDKPLVTVGAGAGTGKTWVLSTRFARLLFSAPTCLPQEILTLTFTEAAAREMQERIRKRVFELIAELPQEEQLFWQAVKDGFDESWISTIHSFAGRLIKESGLSLDIDPRSSIISAPQEEAFWSNFERSLETLDLSSAAKRMRHPHLLKTAQQLEEDKTLLALLERWNPAIVSELIRSTIEMHSSQGLTSQTLLAWADAAEKNLDPLMNSSAESIREMLIPKWENAWNLWLPLIFKLRPLIIAARDTALKKTDTKRASIAILMGNFLETWSAFEGAPAPDHDIQKKFYIELCTFLSGDNSALSKAINAELGETAVSWRDKQKKWKLLSESLKEDSELHKTEGLLRAALLRLSAFAWELWDENKRRRGLLSFSDLIRYAAFSIQNDERAKGFKHILIDEFQDTDPLQDSMIQALRCKEKANLFIVGDPKQSIYRFRHADLTLFADYMLLSQKSDAQVTLDVSFRTRNALLTSLNSLFSYIWKEGLGIGKQMKRLRFEPLSSPLLAPPERELSTLPPFNILLAVQKGRKKSDFQKQLAEELAKTLLTYYHEGRTVWDKKEQCLRPLRWSDCAVLTPTRSEYPILEKALEAAGIPVIFEKSMSYFTRGEVTDIVNTLRAAAFPRDETALAGWLSSPFSGLSQSESNECLKTYAAERRLNNIFLYDLLSEQFPKAAEKLLYLRNIGYLQGPSALLSYLLKDRRWLDTYPDSQRNRVVANINRAITVAIQYENGVASSLTGCAQWLDATLRSQKEIEEPQCFDETYDAIRVTTIHASKGLEYPLVVLMRTESGHERKKNSSSLLPSKNMGIALSDIPDMISSDTPEIPCSLKWEEALSFQGEIEESARLFYVAATRARDSLILCGIVSSTEKEELKLSETSWLYWTFSWLAHERSCDWKDLKGPPLVFINEAPEENNTLLMPLLKNKKTAADTACSPAAITPPKASVLPEAEKIALLSLSATSFALFEWCPFAWRRRHRQGLNLRWETPDEEGPGGSELGTLAHWILARWDFNSETLSTLLGCPNFRKKIPPFLRDCWENRENKEALNSWLNTFAISSEGQRISSFPAETLWRENAFCVLLKDTRLLGATDILWQDPNNIGHWHVRDYKITLSDHAPTELYRAQLAFYALVVKLLAQKQSLPFHTVDVGLIFLREGGRLGDLKTFRSDENWEKIEDSILNVSKISAQGPWIPKKEHCPICPWAKSCPKGLKGRTSKK